MNVGRAAHFLEAGRRPADRVCAASKSNDTPHPAQVAGSQEPGIRRSHASCPRPSRYGRSIRCPAAGAIERRRLLSRTSHAAAHAPAHPSPPSSGTPQRRLGTKGHRASAASVTIEPSGAFRKGAPAVPARRRAAAPSRPARSGRGRPRPVERPRRQATLWTPPVAGLRMTFIVSTARRACSRTASGPTRGRGVSAARGRAWPGVAELGAGSRRSPGSPEASGRHAAEVPFREANRLWPWPLRRAGCGRQRTPRERAGTLPGSASTDARLHLS